VLERAVLTTQILYCSQWPGASLGTIPSILFRYQI